MVRATLCALLMSACSVDGVVLVVHEDVPTIDASTPDATPIDAAPSADARSIDASLVEAAVDAQWRAIGACRIGGAADGFYESFADGPLAAARWLIADGNGFARANVAIEDGALALHATPNSSAAIATVDLFSSGTYQVQGRISDGVELALWWRRDDESDGTLSIASPGQDYAHVSMRSRDGAGTSENQFALPAALDDGQDHILRFDRYTTATPAVTFWVDDELRWSTNEHLPLERAGRMWIVASGNGSVRIGSVFITPFGNDGDRCRDGELLGAGLVPP